VDGRVRIGGEWGRVVPEWRVDLSVPVPEPDRATRVMSWLGWHFFELTGVTVPTVVAVVATPWAWVVSGVVGAGWTVHSVRTARAQAAIRSGRDVATVDGEAPRESGADVESEDATGVGSVSTSDSTGVWL
jgi:hypothetical protein